MMSISGVSGAGAAGGLAAGQPSKTPGGDSVVQKFLDYMKETPAQRMEDSWLSGHHLTRAQLDAMPADQRTAILKQMADDIRDQAQKSAADKANKVAKDAGNVQSSLETNILV